MNNETYQKKWQELIMHGNSSALAIAIGMDAKVLELYQGFVWNHYQGVLKKMFPRINAVWNMNWTEVAREYFAEFPPIDWELNEMAFNFPKFLGNNTFKQEFPEFLPELAQYEVSEFTVYKSQFKPNKSFGLNPTLLVHEYTYDIANWVKEMDQLEKAGKIFELKNSKPAKTPSILFIAQNPKTRLCVFTSPSLVDIAIYEVMSQIEFDTENIISELKKGIDQILPLEHSVNVTTKVIEQQVEFLKWQCVII